ncbi:hypothetical protein PLICRDRAFT_67127, partial [Plicaturopsis crispa FD-325 SS-3]
YWKALHPPPNIHVEMDSRFLTEFVEAYKSDTSFGARWADSSKHSDYWDGGRRFYRDTRDLLFFRDADFRPRLCVPTKYRWEILKEAHESPTQSAHSG